MSHSKALSSSEAQTLRELLERVKRTEFLSEFIHPEDLALQEWDELETEDVSLAMNDASKRRFTEMSEGDANHGKTRQEPIRPGACPGQSAGSDGLSPSIPILPKDVKDLSDWGSTIMKIGKFASQQMSYHEMANSQDAEISKYLTWLMKSVSERNRAQYQDLVQYLKMIKYGEPSSVGFVRERKKA